MAPVSSSLSSSHRAIPLIGALSSSCSLNLFSFPPKLDHFLGTIALSKIAGKFKRRCFFFLFSPLFFWVNDPVREKAKASFFYIYGGGGCRESLVDRRVLSVM